LEPAKPLSAPVKAQGLGHSARASLLWGGGFTLLRDVAQFGVMLILVRILSPTDYGTAAFVQSIIGAVSIVSYSTFSLHALQIRDPESIDWQAHFTAAAVINTLLFGVVLLLAFGLTFTATYRDAALPLAALGIVLLLEIPATLRARMLEANHDWKRFRVQLIIGTLLGMAVGLAVALLGGGVWALILQPPVLGLPAAFDLLVLQRFRPDWTWSWARYHATVRFALDRIGSGLFGRARALSENILVSDIYDVATLGIFTRANGLALLLAGRIGATTVMALHPVLTRAERASERFQRLASLVLRGVFWTTMPAVAFLALTANDTVLLLYGTKWESVVPLLPYAAMATGMVGAWNTLSGLLLANDDSRATLSIDAVAGVTTIGLVFLLVPYGPKAYLAGLALNALAFASITIAVLLQRGAVSAKGVTMAIVPAAVASLAGAAVALALRASPREDVAILFRLMLDGVFLATTYVLTLRIVFSTQLTELLEVVPGGPLLARALMLPSPRPGLATSP
jgi:O-antigen/teichoic acid export membrane protein